MAFAISEFKSNLKGGGAKSALFQVDLNYPSIVNSPAVNAHFLISAASIPASTIGTVGSFRMFMRASTPPKSERP